MRLFTQRITCALAVVTAALVVASASTSGVAAQSKKKPGGPETFNAKARVANATGVADAALSIQIDQYTPEKDLKAMEAALQAGGSDAFVAALKKAPVAGHLKAGDKAFTIRWARSLDTPKGRAVSVVTDSAVYFVGAGLPGAQPRAGFDVAVAQMTIDTAGLGEGSIALAAKVKTDGKGGVAIEDYATEPVKLLSIIKVIS